MYELQTQMQGGRGPVLEWYWSALSHHSEKNCVEVESTVNAN